ncbi:hypothetical protein F5887DRAFT_1232563 [Amanita rubescens]|nr:hypothetical protein F5887DRAFT_1232563 [Amanita rubescens]
MVFRPITRWDAFLILFGATSMQVGSILFNLLPETNMVISTDLTPDLSTTTTITTTTTLLETVSPTPTVSSEKGPPGRDSLPGSLLVKRHVTLLIVSPSKEDFPETRMTTSTDLSAENTPENIALREPTKETMDFLTPEQAQQRWGSEDESAYEVLSAKGNTILYSRHRSGSFPRYMGILARSVHAIITFPLPFSFAPKTIPPHHPFTAPSLLSSKEGQYDRPGFNGYFLCATFPIPSLPVESQFSRPRGDTRFSPERRVSRFAAQVEEDYNPAHLPLPTITFPTIFPA